MLQVNQAIKDFYSYLARQEIAWVGVGFSGGLDSTVLLDALVRFKPEDINLQAIHVHHGLQEIADSWVVHCQDICDSLEVPLEIYYAQVASGASLEKQARVARYKAYKSMQFSKSAEQGVICLAHHQADKAETFMLNLLRGAGVAGLSSIPKARQLDEAKTIYRPLLDVPYASLQSYAAKYQLVWVEDPTNQETEYRRNFIRNELFPLMQTRWQQVEAKIAQAADFQLEAQELLEDLAEEDLAKVEHSATKINYKNLAQFSLKRQKNILRFWLWKFHKKRLDAATLDWVFKEAIPAKQDAQPSRKLDAFELRRFNKYIFYLDETKEDFSFNISGFDDFISAGIKADLAQVGGVRLPDFSNNKVVIRSINPTDKLNRKSLKKWFQQEVIPPWEREFWPVLEIDNKLAAVIGYRVFDEFKAQLNEQSLILTKLT